jgi:GNAT superfamily N-acetyltransferase
VAPDIKKFLDGPARNEWLFAKKIHVYVRKGHHIVNGKIQLCFDVATIDVPPQYQRQGVFTKWLAEVEAYLASHKDAPQIVFVESILERNLVPFLARNGYQFTDDTQTCMFKFVV